MAPVGSGVEIQLLGRFSVRRGGEEIAPGAFRGRLVRRLIRVLLTRRGSFVAHDVLTEALWPGRTPSDPTANLKVLVSRARAGLGDPTLIVTGPGGYSFAVGDACRVDAEEFLEAAARGQRRLRDGDTAGALRLLTATLERWSGEPLAEDAYEEWSRDYRAALGRAHVQALEDAARAALLTGDPAQAVALAGAAAALEPLRDGCHRVLAEAQAAAGDTVAALRTIDSLRRRLGDEVGLGPSKALQDLERRIQRGSEGTAPTVTVPTRAPRPDFAGLSFVGRSREMAATLAALTGPPPGVALVTGAAGVGKSRLLSEVATRGALPVLSVRAFQAERDEPWALARSLLREALALDLCAAGGLSERMVAALVDVVPELEDIRPSVAEAMDAESRRALALEGAVRLLATAAEKEMVLVLDDVQWADSTSLMLLGLIGRRVPEAALALSYRPADVAPGSPLLMVLDDLDGVRTVTAVDLRPFSARAVGELLADPGLAETIARETDGTPLAVVEVIRRLSDEDAIEQNPDGRWRTLSSSAAPLAAEVAREGQLRSIERRVARQSTGQRETLALLALLGREAPARLLATARNTEQSKVLDNLDALARAGLTRLGDAGWATAHDLVAETVAGALPREERGRLHHHLARALDDDGEDPAERAHHLARAGDRRAAAQAFAMAAERRMQHYAADEAAALAGAGIDLDPDPAVLVALLETRAEARNLKGDASAAGQDLRRALDEAAPGPARSRLLVKLALLTGSKDSAESTALAAAALAEAGDNSRARAEALVTAAFLAGDSARPETVDSLASEARSLFEDLNDARGLASVVDAQANSLFFRNRLAEAVPLLRRAARLYRDSGQLTKAGSPMVLEALTLCVMGRYDEARVRCDETFELERSLGQVEGEVNALTTRSHIAVDSGDIDGARRYLAEATAANDLAGTPSTTSFIGLLRGRVAALEGDLEAAEAEFRGALAAGADWPYFAGQAAAALAALQLARGDLETARDFAGQACATTVGPGSLEGRMLLAEIALTRGEPGAEIAARQALQAAAATDYAPSAEFLRLRRLLDEHEASALAAMAPNRARKVFMFTDIVSSSTLIEVLGDEGWDHLLRWHDQTLRAVFADHAGEEINRIGDGFFVAFDGVDNSLACAVAIQRALAAHRRDHGFAPHVRIGIHQAEATRQGHDYQGRGVHQAARIGGAADGDEILVSRETLDAFDGFPTSAPRLIPLKGFSEPVAVVSVAWR